MTYEQIFDKVADLLLSQLNIDKNEMKPESRLVEDLGADSANMLILICDIEGEFDITVDNEMLTQIKTMDDAVKYLQQKLA